MRAKTLGASLFYFKDESLMCCWFSQPCFDIYKLCCKVCLWFIKGVQSGCAAVYRECVYLCRSPAAPLCCCSNWLSGVLFGQLGFRLLDWPHRLLGRAPSSGAWAGKIDRRMRRGEEQSQNKRAGRDREEREESGCQQTSVGIHQREIVLSERVGSWLWSSPPCSDLIQTFPVKRSSSCQETFSEEGVYACQSNDEPVVSQGKGRLHVNIDFPFE